MYDAGINGQREIERAQPLPSGAAPAEDKHRRHGEHGEQRQAEADVDHQFRERRHGHHHGAESLAQDGVDRRVPARVHLGRAAEERLVLGHGVVHARADGHHGIHRGDDRDRHQRGEHAGHARAEQVGCRERADRDHALQILQRRGVDEDHVERRDRAPPRSGCRPRWRRAACAPAGALPRRRRWRRSSRCTPPSPTAG